MPDVPPDDLPEPGAAEGEHSDAEDPGYGTDGYEAGEDDGEYAEEDDAPAYRPPGFLDALRSSRSAMRTRTPRSRAQPATGTDAEAKAVHTIDRRERIIAGFLGLFQLILAIAFYLELRKIVVKASKSLKISVHQAHLDTISDHHLAPYFLVVNLVLGAAIIGSVLAKRRSLVGFTILLAGLGLLSYGGGLIGFVYLGIGIWLIFRSRKRSATARAAAAGGAGTAGGARRDRIGAGRAGRAASASTPADPTDAKIAADRRALQAGAAKTAAAVRKPPPPSKRYTPPSPRRPSPPKVTANAEPEKESRLTSWLRR